MHFSLKTLPPITKEKILVLWILHLLMIIGPLWNIVLCIIEVITGYRYVDSEESSSQSLSSF